MQFYLYISQKSSTFADKKKTNSIPIYYHEKDFLLFHLRYCVVYGIMRLQ